MIVRPGFQSGNRDESGSREPLLRRSAPWQGASDRLPTRRCLAFLDGVSAPDRERRPGKQVHVN